MSLGSSSRVSQGILPSGTAPHLCRARFEIPKIKMREKNCRCLDSVEARSMVTYIKLQHHPPSFVFDAAFVSPLVPPSFPRSAAGLTPSLSRDTCVTGLRAVSPPHQANAHDPYYLVLSLSSLLFVFSARRAALVASLSCRGVTELDIISRIVGLHARANLKMHAAIVVKVPVYIQPSCIDVFFARAMTVASNETRVSRSTIPSPLNYHRKQLLLVATCRAPRPFTPNSFPLRFFHTQVPIVIWFMKSRKNFIFKLRNYLWDILQRLKYGAILRHKDSIIKYKLHANLNSFSERGTDIISFKI